MCVCVWLPSGVVFGEVMERSFDIKTAAGVFTHTLERDPVRRSKNKTLLCIIFCIYILYFITLQTHCYTLKSYDIKSIILEETRKFIIFSHIEHVPRASSSSVFFLLSKLDFPKFHSVETRDGNILLFSSFLLLGFG
jgi:hypothetical protein